MGQYYKIVFLAEKQDGSDEIIRAWVELVYSKLMEGSYLDNDFLYIIEYLLSSEGMFYRSRIIWAGDYADKEEVTTISNVPTDSDSESAPNLYQLCEEDGKSLTSLLKYMRVKRKIYSYLVNHTKKQFVYMKKDGKTTGIHPLPLLVSEGNGRGGGDYFGSNSELCGTWARDIISVEEKEGIPAHYTELICEFSEE
jgi:hypothetical protein